MFSHIYGCRRFLIRSVHIQKIAWVNDCKEIFIQSYLQLIELVTIDSITYVTKSVEVIKPNFKDLSDPNLLERFLKTQNTYESIHTQCILFGTDWQNCFCGVSNSVLCFNESSNAKVNVLERLAMKLGKFLVEELSEIDQGRVKKGHGRK